MYYKFGSNTGDELANAMDSDVIAKILDEKYGIGDIEDYDEQVVKMKKIIKDPNEFNSIMEESKTEVEELIDSLVRIFPYKLFNHHLIKYLKVNYLNE